VLAAAADSLAEFSVSGPFINGTKILTCVEPVWSDDMAFLLQLEVYCHPERDLGLVGWTQGTKRALASMCVNDPCAVENLPYTDERRSLHRYERNNLNQALACYQLQLWWCHRNTQRWWKCHFKQLFLASPGIELDAIT